jgi:hypothetical protein
MKSFRNFVVLFAIATAAVAANAQNSFEAKFQLTSPARWGDAVLPAGEYTFAIDSMEQPVRAFIHSTDKKVGIVMLALASENAAPGGSYLFLTGEGTNRTVRSINLPQLGMALVYKPLRQRERETLYAHASQTVPVQIAKK